MITAKYGSSRIPLQPWLEGFAIPCIALGLALWVSPHDPFLLKASFPWLWLAPVLAALRYGLGPAVLSVAVLIVSFVGAQRGLPALGLHHLPENQFLGGIVLTLLTGEYGSLWILRLRRSEQMSSYATQQLESLTRTLHMTRLSHDRLEQSVISKPVTLRDSLLELRQLLGKTHAALEGEVASRLLHLTAYHGGFEQAALYAVTNEVIDPMARATIGPDQPLQPHDILITRCLEKHRTAYWAANSLKDGEQSAYLVVAPMHTSDGTLLGILVVTAMPFLFLNEDNLLAISVLLAYFADDAYAVQAAYAVTNAVPGCPPRFAAEIIKLQRVFRDLNIPSTLSTIFVPDHPARPQILTELAALSRGLDEIWQTQVGDTVALVTLMPFSSRAVAEGYMHRVENHIKERFGIKFDGKALATDIRGIGTDDAATMLLRLLGPRHGA
ncbi:MAG: PelD GGDEF domain-containing protein [Acidiferrobacter sp.]